MTYSYCKVYLNGCKLEKTTKKEKQGHGIGIESVKELVRREEGDLEIFEENNYFISQILIPCKANKICG